MPEDCIEILAKQVKQLQETRLERDEFYSKVGTKIDKKTFYETLQFVVNNFEGAKEFINAKVKTIQSSGAQTKDFYKVDVLENKDMKSPFASQEMMQLDEQS